MSLNLEQKLKSNNKYIQHDTLYILAQRTNFKGL